MKCHRITETSVYQEYFGYINKRIYMKYELVYFSRHKTIIHIIEIGDKSLSNCS